MTKTRENQENANLVRSMARQATMVGLSTLRKDNGDPFVSMLAMATDSFGNPIFMSSKLSKHTQNFTKDPRASILVTQTIPKSTNQDFPRASLMGKVGTLDDKKAQERYLRRYPHTREYLSFGDFEFYALSIERIYMVGGFARVGHISPQEYLCEPLLSDIEDEAITHMNEDHKDTLKRYGEAYLGLTSEDWILTGIDVEGFDIAMGGLVHRINFPETVTNSAQLRKIFTDM